MFTFWILMIVIAVFITVSAILFKKLGGKGECFINDKDTTEGSVIAGGAIKMGGILDDSWEEVTKGSLDPTDDIHTDPAYRHFSNSNLWRK